MVDGTFPKSLLDSIAKTNEEEKITKHIKRIVEFTDEEKKAIISNIKFFQTTMIIITHITIYNLFILLLLISINSINIIFLG